MDNTVEHILSSNDIIAFPKMGIEFNINDVAFSIFGFDIKWYGVIIAAGMLLAMIYCFRRMKEFGLDSDRTIDVVLGGLIGAIIGARSYYIMFDADKTFADFLDIRGGGLAIYGGLIGGLLVGFIMAKIRKVKFLTMLDIASLGFLIGQGVGRWGNFVNKEAFGSATTLPWGMASASIQSTLGSSSGDVILAHPCFLYESIWCLIGFILLHLYSKHRKFDGELFLMYSAWYGLGRFFIEGLRMDSLYIGRLRISQLLAGVCVVVAVSTILLVRGHFKRNGAAVLYYDTDESKELLLQAEQRIANDNEKRIARAEKKANKADKTDEVKPAENADVTADDTISAEKSDEITEDKAADDEVKNETANENSEAESVDDSAKTDTEVSGESEDKFDR